MYLWNNTFLCFVMEFSILRYSRASFLDPSSSSFSFSTALTLLSYIHHTVTLRMMHDPRSRERYLLRGSCIIYI